MISCAEAIRALWAYLDDEVSASDRAAIEAHLDACRQCCGEVEFVKELGSLLKHNADLAVPDGVRRRLDGLLAEMEGHGG